MATRVRTPIFAANWKMNHGPTEARAFMAAFLAAYTPRDDRTVVVFPPAISVAAARDARGDRTDVLLGVQNVSTEPKGAFTGETSAAMAADAGAAMVLVGHSERRHIFGETDEQTARKCAVVAANGLIPVLCVGETLAQREAEETESVVVRQLLAGVALLDRVGGPGLIVAYEPVWAIGTGRTARPDDASVVHKLVRQTLRDAMGPTGEEVPVLYGGSANRDNAAALLAAPGVDGLLVGGASLDAAGWAAICRT